MSTGHVERRQVGCTTALFEDSLEKERCEGPFRGASQEPPPVPSLLETPLSAPRLDDGGGAISRNIRRVHMASPHQTASQGNVQERFPTALFEGARCDVAKVHPQKGLARETFSPAAKRARARTLESPLSGCFSRHRWWQLARALERGRSKGRCLDSGSRPQRPGQGWPFRVAPNSQSGIPYGNSQRGERMILLRRAGSDEKDSNARTAATSRGYVPWQRLWQGPDTWIP
ncbi:hypothetical protein M885DRAFT_80921 [Pelagophyceae sp. CCMP2097]|nr:hypothetical protein M885DRAFT_80921 [Pelagophyceae sp. CCMP2097]